MDTHQEKSSPVTKIMKKCNCRTCSGICKTFYTIYFASCNEISICFHISLFSCLSLGFEIRQTIVEEQRAGEGAGTMYENTNTIDILRHVNRVSPYFKIDWNKYHIHISKDICIITYTLIYDKSVLYPRMSTNNNISITYEDHNVPRINIGNRDGRNIIVLRDNTFTHIPLDDDIYIYMKDYTNNNSAYSRRLQNPTHQQTDDVYMTIAEPVSENEYIDIQPIQEPPPLPVRNVIQQHMPSNDNSSLADRHCGLYAKPKNNNNIPFEVQRHSQYTPHTASNRKTLLSINIQNYFKRLFSRK